MTDIILSDLQADAVRRTVDWFRHRTKEQQIWRLYGMAGTGKSTILKFIIDELGAEAMPRIERDREKRDARCRKLQASGASWRMDDSPGGPMDCRSQTPAPTRAAPKVIFGAFTGKASLVMTRKGTPASTIHSMCYAVSDTSEEAVKKARAELAEMVLAGLDRQAIREKELTIKAMHKPTFVLNQESAVADCDLIVLDEVSMVNETMAHDLMSFRKPILVLGDPGQLPPIKGEGFFTQAAPDVLLTEIHRQAVDSPIIRLATLAREGKHIPYGNYGDDVAVMSRYGFDLGRLAFADQILTGMNATRIMLNNQLRANAGRVNGPTEDDKYICLKNQNDIGLVNGMFLSLSNIGEPTEYGFRATVTTEDGDELGEKTIYRGWFDDHIHLDKERAERDYFRRKGMTEIVYGNAITVHKSQGSQWGNVAIYDDGFGRGDDRQKWLYTALTRSEKGLLLLK